MIGAPTRLQIPGISVNLCALAALRNLTLTLTSTFHDFSNQACSIVLQDYYLLRLTVIQ